MPLILNGTTGVSGIDGSAGTPSYVGGDSDTGLWYPAANTLALSTSGSERLRIDSSGNVGIGTTSPSYPLQVVKNANGAQRVLFSNNSSGSAAEAVIAVSNGTAEGSIRVAGTSYGGYGAYTANNTLIYNDTSAITIMADNATNGIIKFATGSNSERMRIDSSGNVGIGTSTPAKLLHLYNATSSVGATQLLLEGATNAYGAGISFQSRTSSGGTLVEMARITADGEDAWNTTSSTQDAGLRFYTTLDGTNTERMRITSGGNLLINTTTNSFDRVQIYENNAAYNSLYLNSSSNTGTQYYISFSRQGTQAGYLTSNSSTTVQLNNSSDVRLKENITDANSAIPSIMSAKVRQFDWKENISPHQDFGFVAQELVDVIPEAVTAGIDNEDGTIKTPWGIDYSHIVPRLVKAIQEQQAMIEELKAKVAALEK